MLKIGTNTEISPLSDSAATSTANVTAGSPQFKTNGILPETNEVDLLSRDLKILKTMTFEQLKLIDMSQESALIDLHLSVGDNGTLQEFINFIKKETNRHFLPLIAEIKIKTVAQTDNVQVHKKMVEKLWISLDDQRGSFNYLKKVTFGEAPQPYIHLGKLPRSEKIEYRGMLFSNI